MEATKELRTAHRAVNEILGIMAAIPSSGWRREAEGELLGLELLDEIARKAGAERSHRGEDRPVGLATRLASWMCSVIALARRAGRELDPIRKALDEMDLGSFERLKETERAVAKQTPPPRQIRGKATR